MPTTAISACQAGTPPIASRIGISVGANIGIIDMTDQRAVARVAGQDRDTEDVPDDHEHQHRCDDAGHVLLPGDERGDGGEREGVRHEARAGTRRPARSTVPAAADAEIESAPVARPTATPTPPMTTIWISPTTPMPATLPAISCHGRTVASSSSTTRLRLLLDHALGDRLAVEHQRHVDQDAGDDADDQALLRCTCAAA